MERSVEPSVQGRAAESSTSVPEGCPLRGGLGGDTAGSWLTELPSGI